MDGENLLSNDQETPDILFSEEMPELNFSNDDHNPTNETDIDDLEEPDQYVEDEAGNAEYAEQSDSGEDNAENSNTATGIDILITTVPSLDYLISLSISFSSSSHTDPRPKQIAKSSDNRLIKLPLSRVKQIMKADDEVTLITSECLFAVTKAAELFIESLAQESFVHTSQAKKKTIQKRDVDLALSAVDSLIFLEGATNF